MKNPYSIEVSQNAEGVSRALAEHIVQLAASAVAARSVFSIALAGGSTPRELYRCLAGDTYRHQLDWQKVQVFWGDERAVSATHPDSNYRMANETLLRPCGVPAERIHRLEGELPDLDAAARRYQAQLARVHGVAASSEPPALDLVLLGMGADGHCASLFPGCRAVEEKERWVVSEHVEQLATRRLTLTVPMLTQARHIAFMVLSHSKAKILRQVLTHREPPELPSQLIAQRARNLTWFIDRAAASQLNELRPESKNG